MFFDYPGLIFNFDDPKTNLDAFIEFQNNNNNFFDRVLIPLDKIEQNEIYLDEYEKNCSNSRANKFAFISTKNDFKSISEQIQFDLQIIDKYSHPTNDKSNFIDYQINLPELLANENDRQVIIKSFEEIYNIFLVTANRFRLLNISFSFNFERNWEENFSSFLRICNEYNYKNYDSSLNKNRIRFDIKIPFFYKQKNHPTLEQLYFILDEFGNAGDRVQLFIDSDLETALSKKDSNNKLCVGVLNLILGIGLTLRNGISLDDFIELMSLDDLSGVKFNDRNSFWRGYEFSYDDFMHATEDLINGFTTPFYKEYINDLKRINII